MNSAPTTTGSDTQNLHIAQQQLREIKKVVDLHREEHLNDLTEVAVHTDDQSKKKLILHLKMAEQNRKCFAIHCNCMNRCLWADSHAYCSPTQ